MSTPANETPGTFATSYQHWFGPATFLRCPHQPDFKDTDIGLVGVPHCGGNPIEHMQYLGPRGIRNRSMGYARSHREFGTNPFELVRIRDLGDVPMPRGLNPDFTAEDIQSFFEKVYGAGILPVSVGGDHSITGPILRAARGARFTGQPLALIHFDSHNDAMLPLLGTRNHAGPFRFAVEDGIIDPRRTIQIGLRGPMGDPAMDDWAKENFAEFITTETFLKMGPESVLEKARAVVGDHPTYLTFDLDVIDPSEAPGVADPELNGLRLREILSVIHGFRGLNLVGADIVCYCPPLDNPSQITALTGSLLMLEFVTLMAERLAQRG